MINTNGKKHIVITGNRKSGKTTLFNQLISEISNDKIIPGITTWAVPGQAVYMRKNGTDDMIKIGEFNPNSTGLENKMQPVYEGFINYGVAYLQELINSDNEWVSIDEIGYLESTCEEYKNIIFELFNNKKVICVVRKQDVDFLNEILARDDVWVRDLDVGELL